MSAHMFVKFYVMDTSHETLEGDVRDYGCLKYMYMGIYVHGRPINTAFSYIM